MSRSAPSFRQLAGYILDEKKVAKEQDGQPYIFTHNLAGMSIDEFVQAFKENNNNRAFSRKGSLTLYHEVISWHAKDADKINPQSVEAIARKYAELRNPNALFLGGIHEDQDSKHLHLMVSAVEAVSGRSIRVSKGRFEQIKKELQAFEQERFGLVHSEVEHGKHSMRRSDREYQLEKQTGKPSRKEEIKSALEQAFSASLTQDQFYENVRASGLSTYERGGKVAGIDDGRHFRFATLGYGDEKFEELDIRTERLDEINDMRGRGEENIERKEERNQEFEEKSDENVGKNLGDEIEMDEMERG